MLGSGVRSSAWSRRASTGWERPSCSRSRRRPPLEEERRVSLECMACQLTAGERGLAGGRIFQTEHWVVEHCIGTLGVGTLILKPFRHIVGLADMSDAEAADLGPLMQRATS